MYVTNQIRIKQGHRMYEYFHAMCSNSKNMQNTTNFYIRQVYTALKNDKPLQTLQKEVLDIIYRSMKPINQIQQQAYEKKLVNESKKPEEKRKEVKCNVFDEPTKDNPYVDYHFLDALFKFIKQDDYRSLPIQSSQWAMKQVFQNWKSFFQSLKDYKTNPEKYKAKPRIPNYFKCHQKEVLFTNQDCVIKENKLLKFPKTKERLNIGKLGLGHQKLKQVRVIPKYNHFVVELVMEVKQGEIEYQDNNRYMSIDLGINNLATIVTNTGVNPVLVKGKYVKSINQYYNKQIAHYMGILRHGKNANQGLHTSKRLERLHEKRHFKIKDAFHKMSRKIVNLAVQEDINTIFIGKNKDWKQNINIGKSNNQQFVSIPFNMLISMIDYKAEEYGMKVEVVEEAYTSKASFIDGDDLPVYQKGKKHTFSGKRVKRGLYKSKDGLLINADVNGSANIMRKGLSKLNKLCDVLFEQINVLDPVSI